MYYAAIALTIAANIGYHVFQKSVRPEASPAASLVITYGVALVCSLVLLVVMPTTRSVGATLGQAGWASYALGIAVVGLEIGFLLAYRAGWDLGLAAPYVNVAAALVLLPLGVLLFGDQLTPRKAAGAALALAGLWLLASRATPSAPAPTGVEATAAPQG